MAVSRIRVTVAVGAVLLWAVTPVLTCLLPCLATGAAKQDCSHQMAMHCGHSTIASSRNCCAVSSRPEIATVETQVRQSDKRVLAVVLAVAQVLRSDLTTRPASLAFLESPPSEAPPSSFSVLRV